MKSEDKIREAMHYTLLFIEQAKSSGDKATEILAHQIFYSLSWVMDENNGGAHQIESFIRELVQGRSPIIQARRIN